MMEHTETQRLSHYCKMEEINYSTHFGINTTIQPNVPTYEESILPSALPYQYHEYPLTYPFTTQPISTVALPMSLPIHPLNSLTTNLPPLTTLTTIHHPSHPSHPPPTAHYDTSYYELSSPLTPNFYDFNYLLQTGAMNTTSSSLNLLFQQNLKSELELVKPTAGRPANQKLGKRRVLSLPTLTKLPINTTNQPSSSSNVGSPSTSSNHLNNLKVYTCPKDGCSKSFKRTEHLKRHLNTVHSGIKPFICNFKGCDKRFSRSDNLNQHQKTHLPKHERKRLA